MATPWRGSIDCEGGPVIVAKLADFLHWRGIDPLPDSERRELHLWSLFTSELPEHFRPNGPNGHQFIPAPDHAALEAMRDELFRFVADKWPGTTISKRFERWRIRRPDGGVLNVVFEPASEYDRCIRHLREIQLHAFDAGRRCLVWSSVAQGVVDVLRLAEGHLLLVQVEFADDDEQAESALQSAIAHAQARDDVGEISFVIDESTVVVAWAPTSARDFPAELLADRGSATAPGVPLDSATGMAGALLGMLPGTYSVTTGSWNDERSGGGWCSLRLRDQPAQQDVPANGTSSRP
jgi:hypothetical protein